MKQGILLAAFVALFTAGAINQSHAQVAFGIMGPHFSVMAGPGCYHHRHRCYAPPPPARVWVPGHWAIDRWGYQRWVRPHWEWAY